MVNKIYEHITIEDLVNNSQISEECVGFCSTHNLNTLYDINLFHKNNPSSYYSKFGARIFREIQRICDEDEEVYRLIFRLKQKEKTKRNPIRYQEVLDLIESLSEQQRELLLFTSELVANYRNNIEKKSAKYDDVNIGNFVVEFYERNGHFPMFWIFEKKLINNSSREADMLKKTYNTFQDQQLLSLRELAEEYKTTRERFRQISFIFHSSYSFSQGRWFKGKEKSSRKDSFNTKNVFKLLNIKNDSDWDYYKSKFRDFDALWQEDYEVSNLLSDENSVFTSSFIIQILSVVLKDTHILFGGFRVTNIKSLWQNAVLIKKEYTDIFDFEKFIKNFQSYIADNDTEHELNIEKDYLPSSDCWKSIIDLNKFDSIVRVVKDILLYEFQLYSEPNGLIKIPAMKKRNVLDVVYEILKDHGNPMHIDDIYIEFKKILPEHNYSEASQLRSWLQRHEAISYRSRKSVYTLKEWKHVKSGTIRDAIVEFLLKNDTPKNADEITDYVLRFFPKTNKASIRTSMFNDTKKRFSFFGNNLFGLLSKEYPSEYEEIEQPERQRKSFEQRLYDLEKFISENDHFPFANSENEEETALNRWWRNSNTNIIKLTKKQKAEIERVKVKYNDFETDKATYEWFCRLKEFKLFVLENRRLPSSREDEKFLYNWLRRARRNFKANKLNEKQRQNFVELFKEIDYVDR